MRRRALGLVAALGAALVLAGPAPAASAAACSGSSGVTVVVDYGPLGGIQVGCATGDPGSGLSALHGAGFGTVGTQKDGPAFVCRINGVPAADPCVLTPPSSAYWSYWHASRGGSWSYSSLGAAGYNPAPGSVEGWSYGAGGRPGIAPPAAPAPPPAPRPTTQPAPKPTVKPAPPRTSAPGAPRAPDPTAAPGGPGASSVPVPGRSSTGAPGSSARPSAGPSATTVAPSTSAGASAPPGSTAVAGAEATEEPGPPGGGSAAVEPTGHPSVLAVVGTILGVLLVIALAVVAFVIARRRRTAV